MCSGFRGMGVCTNISCVLVFRGMGICTNISCVLVLGVWKAASHEPDYFVA